MESRVKEILSWYSSDSPGTRTNIARLLNHGRLAGTGKLVILPVDQGFEHGPARSFAVNAPAYDPSYHFRLAIDAGCNAYAAPLGFLEAGAAEFAGEVPLILKMNNHDVLHDEKDPLSAVTGSVKDALRLGCVAVGFTIYPGSSQAQIMYQQCREMIQEAKASGLAAVVWSYPRGTDVSKAGETGLDVVAYAAQIAAQLGAHVIKVPLATLSERVRHVVQSAFDGRRIVIFSGGATKENDEAIFDECRGIRDGGGFGSIIGRNSFQRPRDHALRFLDTVMKIYSGEKK
jgi:class I fructose-bisphosphate aldolase